jgi:hypothetical protein
MEANQDIIFIGGLNSDDSLELIPQGDYLDLENAENFDDNADNKLGKVSKVKGNILLPNNYRLATIGDLEARLQSAKCCGSVKDITNDKVYFMSYEIYSDGIRAVNYYTIYEYSNSIKAITNCVVRTALRIFDENSWVKWGNVIDGKLAWTQESIDNPKMINIERAINFTKNSYNGALNFSPTYLQMSMEEFNVIRKPPIKPVTAEYCSNDNYIKNNIRGRLFQFRAKYVYYDNSESVWGAISDVVLPLGETQADGFFNEDADFNFNYLRLTFYKESSDIKEVWLSSRYIDKDGILSEFSIFEKNNVLNYNFDDTITYDFYNDIQGTILSSNDDAKVLDTVPLNAGTMEVISNPDRLTYANIKEATWDNIDIDVDVEVVSEDVTIGSQAVSNNTNVIYSSATELGCYQIEDTLVTRPRIRLNGNGACTMIMFNSNWIATGAETIRVKLSATVGDVLYSYSTGHLNISGLTPAQITQKIVDRINTDYTGAGGTTVVAFNNYNTFITAVNGGYLNTNTAQWTGVEDYMFYGYTPTGSYINIRTGLVLKMLSLPSGLSFPDASVKILTYPTSLNVRRYTGWQLGKYYLNNSLGHIVNTMGYVSAPDFYTGSDVFIRVNNCLGYSSVKLNSPESLAATYEQSQLVDNGFNSTPTLNPFGKYAVGIVYYDEYLRPCYVQKIDEVDIQRTDTDYALALIYRLRLTINHYAPTWARYWSVVLSNNLNQKTFTEVDLSIDTGTPITDNADYIYIDVNTSILLWDIVYNNTGLVYEPYIFTKGDRVVIYNTTTKKYIDREIVATDADGKIMIEKGTLTDSDIGDIVRFYSTQIRYVEDVYKEVGQIYELSEGTYSIGGQQYRLHQAPNGLIETSQSSTNPLTFVLPFGDVYLNAINHYAINTGVGTTNNPTYNEFYEPFYQSKLNAYGRSFVANAKVKTSRYESRIRISNALIQDSNTMGINTFDSTDYMNIPSKHGKIQGIAELGYTLKIVTESKTMSIYVNRTVTVDPNGQEGVLLVNKTLGTLYIPEQSYGTIHPNTITKSNRNLYFLDAYNKVLVRDSANGQSAVSDYKYSSFFKRLSDNIVASTTSVQPFGVFYKKKFGLILNIVSPKFIGIPDNKGNAIFFNESLNRWTHHLRLSNRENDTPEWGETIGTTMLAFLNGELYIQDRNDEMCRFFEDDKPSEIQFVFNQDPKQIKLLTAIAVHGNNLWDARENGDIYIEPNTTYASGMSSRLKPAKFRKKEGVFYSEFLRNGLTPNMTYDNAIVNGHKLRGDIAKIRLRNYDNVKSDLFSVSIKYVNSELSY